MRYFFSYVSFLCYDIHVVRWVFIRDRTLLHRKWLHVIINDDFLEKGECYGLALLPLIICLGSLHIACRYIFNLWQLCQGVDSLTQWLEHLIFIQTDWFQIPRQVGNFFSYVSFLCYDFHVVRWEGGGGGGPIQVRTLFNRKWLRVIINDDFLEKGECYDLALLPSIIHLGRLCIASRYIFNFWQLRQLVDSLAQWLEHWTLSGQTVFESHDKWETFSAMLHSFVATFML